VLGFGVLPFNPLVDRLSLIVEIGVKPVDDLRLGCLSPGLKILRSATQIGAAFSEAGKVRIASCSFANAVDFAPKRLGASVECEVPRHLRYRSR